MNTNPKVSVIIPVYNVENYLRQCLDSVLNQTLKEIEIICVDDGSTDSSLAILQEYAARDRRIMVLRQQNQYAGVARNNGINVASGEYLLFIDSDDYLELPLLEKAFSHAKQLDADIVIYGSYLLNNTTENRSEMPWMVDITSLPIQQPFSRKDIPYTIFQTTTPAPWSKLFRRSFIERFNLRFQALKNSNDLYFTYSALALADRIGYLREPLINYRINHGGNLQAQKTTAPLNFYKALCALQDGLKAQNIYEEVKHSFLREAERNCMFNFRTTKSTFSKAEKTKLLQTFICQRPKVSIIVPVYNVARFLPRCLDSLLAQTMKEIEIVCVDDGSTDNSYDILQEYAQRDSRVVVIHKEKNERTHLARKSGVLAASGAYLMFVDGDDYVTESACQTAYDLITNCDADIVQFSVNVENHSNNSAAGLWLQKHLSPSGETYCALDILYKMFVSKTLPTSLCGKIYTCNLCKKAFSSMPNINAYVGEDIFEAFFLAASAKRYVSQETAPLYQYQYGVGISNQDALPCSNFEEYCKMGILAQHVFQFVRACCDDRLQLLESCAHHLAQRMLEDCCRIYNSGRLASSDINSAARFLIKYWQFYPDAVPALEKTFNMESKEYMSTYFPVPTFVKQAPAFIGTGAIPKISVVIPVYNGEQYLEECLNSVITQTLDNIEIVCINDGSVDNSLDILLQYQEKDPRITVISQKNAGLSCARNHAITHAHGEFIQFLDCDDYLSESALQTLYTVASEKNLDALFFDLNRFTDNTEDISFAPAPLLRREYADIYSGVEFMKTLKNDNAFITSACLLLLRRDFLNEHGINFYDGILHEDELFTFQVLMSAERVSHIGKALYQRRIHHGSIMTTPKSHKNVYGYFFSMQEMLRYGLSINDSPLKLEETLRAYRAMQFVTKNIYAQLNDSERKKLIFENPFSQILFQALVASSAPALRTGTLTSGALNSDQALAAVYSSVSFKLGRLLTWLPRKLRGGFRCLKENGFRYTIMRALAHLHLDGVARKIKGGFRCLKENNLRYTFFRFLVHIGIRKNAHPEQPTGPKRGDYAFYQLLPKSKYEEELALWYTLRTGKKLHLHPPKTFNEKIQWMKLHDSTPEKTRLADKYLVREFVKEKVGEEYLVPLLGVWDRFDEIDFDTLPNRFALKANHGSGWNIIVSDKSKFDIAAAKAKFDRWMRMNFAYFGFELHYMNIPPKIIAEKYIENTDGLIDYRFYCFNGTPQQVWVDIYSGTPQHLRSIFDMDWNPLKMKCTWPDGSKLLSKKPENFEKMKDFATLLSKDFSFVRVDFFEVDGKLYVGELTFTPMSGQGKFQPAYWDRKLGDLLTLPPESPIPEKIV